MAARYAYYCKNLPFLEDSDYDERERLFEKASGRQLPVGSSRPEDYTEAQKALAIYFILVTHARA